MMSVVLTDVTGWLKNNFSTKVFFIGLGCVLGLYIILGAWITLNTEKTLQKQRTRLASQTIVIEDRLLNSLSSSHDPLNRLEAALLRKPESPIDISIDYKLKKMSSGLNEISIEGLSTMEPAGNLPVIRDDGLTVFNAYRLPFDLYGVDRPIISVAIMNLGLSDAATEKAIKMMPPHISLILSPYASLPDFWLREARANGHEVWFSLPTETESYPLHDPGPHTLLISATEKQNKRKMEWLLGRGEGYIGFVTERAPTFVKSTNDIRPVISDIYTRGLAFIDGSESPAMLPQTLARSMEAPYAAIDVWLDTSPNEIHIRKRLNELEAIAKERGMAAGIINAYPLSYKILREWMSTLPERGFVMAPLSAQTGF